MTRLRYSLLVCALAISGLGVTLLAETHGAGAAPSNNVTSYVSDVHANTTPLDPGAALSKVLMGLGPSSAIANGAFRDGSNGVAYALDLNLNIPSDANGEALEAEWEGDIAEGAVADLIGTNSDQRLNLSGGTYTGLLPSGAIEAGIGGGMGDVQHGQAFAGENDSDKAVTDQIAAAIAKHSLTLVDETLLRPFGDVPIVIASTTDPNAAAADLSTTVADMFGTPPRYEGYYLEIRDTSGAAVIRTAAAFRTGAGRLWFVPSLEAAVSIRHG